MIDIINDYLINLDKSVLAVIFFASIIQSIFGVGLLVIGTPILLFLGYDYLTILYVLLPISLSISFFQVIEFRTFVPKFILFNSFFYILPGILFGFLFALKLKIKIKLFLGIFLVLIPIIQKSEFLISFLQKYFFNKGLFILGLFHGLTNLGGSIMPFFINRIENSKEIKLSIVSFLYFVMVFCQLCSIYLFSKFSLLSYVFNLNNIIFGILISLATRFFLGRKIFSMLNASKYSSYLDIYIFIIGFLLLFSFYFEMK